MSDHWPISYDLAVPPRIAFGWGRRCELGTLAAGLGRRALIVWGSRTLKALPPAFEIIESLSAAGIEPMYVRTATREPEVDDVDRITAQMREIGAGPGDVVVAIGGGSAIDLAKAAAAMVTQRQSTSVKDFLEGVGHGLSLVEPPLPLVVLPTTAGTGSEATKNAVISSFDPPFKKSLRSEMLLPRLVIVDPQLTASAPRDVTAHSGMDAVTQLIESYISRRAKPIPRALALHGLSLAVPALPRAVRDGGDRPAREAMAHAALLSGMALANSGLGMAHGVAAALGVHCHTPHGLACAVMLGVALRVNRATCERDYAALAGAIGIRAATTAAAADGFVLAIDLLGRDVGIPRRLSELGVRREQLPELARSSRGNSMEGNPRSLADAELLDILEAAL